MVALEKRLENKQSPVVGLVAKKERVVGSPSKLPVPSNAPSWQSKVQVSGYN